MEFERSIFRVHDRLLKGVEKKKYLEYAQKFFLALSAFSLLNFVIYHNLYVDRNDILKA
jgi:hypothetical protein